METGVGKGAPLFIVSPSLRRRTAEHAAVRQGDASVMALLLHALRRPPICRLWNVHEHGVQRHGFSVGQTPVSVCLTTSVSK